MLPHVLRLGEEGYVPKGNQVNIPEPSNGENAFGHTSGNAIELRDVDGSPGESCLFCVSFRFPGSGLAGDREEENGTHCGSCSVQCALVGP